MIQGYRSKQSFHSFCCDIDDFRLYEFVRGSLTSCSVVAGVDTYGADKLSS